MESSRTQSAADRQLTFREAVLEGIRAEMAADESVTIIGQDIGAFSGPLKCTEGLLETFGPERIVETPICEESMTSMAIGAALTGLRPVVDIMFADLLPVAMPAILQIAATFRYMTDSRATMPLVIRTRGGDGPYRAHPQNYEAIFSHSPGLIVVAPSTPMEAKGLIRSAIQADDPVLFFENIFLYNAPKGFVPDTDFLVPLGKADIARAGRDATVVSYARSVRTALAAADRLAADGISVEVIDLRTLAPLDEETIIESVRRTGRLVTVHEAWLSGGIGAEVVARVAERCYEQLVAPIARIGAPPTPVPWAEALRDEFIPTIERISDAVRAVMRPSVSTA